MDAIFFLTIILIIMAGYYSLVVMPKQRDFKKHQQYVMTLNEGDEVITYGGIIGIVTELDVEEGVAKVQIAPGIEVRIITAALVRQYDPNEIAKNARMGIAESEQPSA